MNDPLDYLSIKIDEERKLIEQHLAKGAASSYEEYRKLCGVIQGLDSVKQIITDLAQQMEQNNDE